MRTLLAALIVAGSATLFGVPAQAQSVDADITVRTGHPDGDNWRRHHVDRGYHRGWDRRYSARRMHRPVYGSCRTVIRKIWRDGERVTIRRRICT